MEHAFLVRQHNLKTFPVPAFYSPLLSFPQPQHAAGLESTADIKMYVE